VGHTLLEQDWPQAIKRSSHGLTKKGGPHCVGARLASSQLKKQVGHTLLEQGWHQAIKHSSHGLNNRWATLCWSKVGLKPIKQQVGHTLLEQGWHQAIKHSSHGFKKQVGHIFVATRLASSQFKNRWALCWSKVGTEPSSIQAMA
jgi:ribulose bisphosphate carboxylase small subunit